jgi:hypothetical protein
MKNSSTTDKATGYRESLLHWIWEHLQFNVQGLQTTTGEALEIHAPGKLNTGYGPDFFNSGIMLDGISLHGHIEIHTSESDWYAHKHHTDHHYNNVILHVVLNRSSGSSAIRADGTAIPTLHLYPLLEKPLASLLKLRSQTSLPCGNHIQFISDDAFQWQIEKAHEEYLSWKCDQLMNFYPAGQILSNAWKQMMVTAVFDLLGTPHNRAPMAQLVSNIPFDEFVTTPSSTLSEKLLQLYHQNSSSWNRGGGRPANHPNTRIPQAVSLAKAIIHEDFKSIIHTGLSVHSKWLELVRMGKQTHTILLASVFIPGFRVLGDLLRSQSLISETTEAWKKTKLPVPDSILKPFINAGFRIQNKTQPAGFIHQYKRYCTTLGCNNCFVFKKAIHC